MAGTKVNNYSNIDTNIQALQLTTDKVFKGLHQLTLTEMDTTTVPAIAAGSVVECNGTLIKYDTEEAIVTTDPHTSATVADGAVYIVIKGADLTAYLTATAPTWSDAKQGYYGLTTWANDRYVGGCYKATASYTLKYLFLTLNSLGLKVFGDKINFGYFSEIEAGTINIQELNMYAYGDLNLFLLNSGTKDFYILRPSEIYLKLVVNAASSVYVSIQQYRDSSWITIDRMGYSGSGLIAGTYYAPYDSSAYPLYANMKTFPFKQGRYRVTLTISSGSANLYAQCLSSEGINTLDASKIISII